jgi:hypothetical protein
MAEKSLVNELVEMLGAALDELELELAAGAELELELELDDELPQAATPTLAHNTSAVIIGLLFSKCIGTYLLFLRSNVAWPRRACAAQRLSQ